MNSSNYAGRVCPICGRRYTAPPALSRTVNAADICPKCGIMEALAAMEGYKAWPLPALPARRETTAEFFNAVVELVKSNGFWPEQSAFITCEPACPDVALCHPMFDFRPVLTAEHDGGLRIDCYLNGIFDRAGNSKRLAGTIQTACSDRDTCVLLGSLTGALLHYGGVHREENLDRYIPLHNRDMKKES